MAALLGSTFPGEVGLRLLLSPFGSNIVTRTACCTVGIGLPVFSTFKAIEEKNRVEQERWLLYWAAYGSFSLVEVFSDKILYWFPFYYHMKFAFLVWLQLPSGNGSKHLYARHLRPFLLKHQARIDQLLRFTSTETMKIIMAHQGEIQFVKAVLERCATTTKLIVKEFTHPLQSHGRNTTESSDGPTSPTRLQIREADPDADN
ncbi:HVA22-like protein k isoform X1 [Iris pallida]|uniref:HVA22-like protein n=1 Tax=Iris pallida TaxID=29817 RepID=A0AAX6H1K3_IRIPA|nr:HVA22-like protein k isoform X1 [Iris pallida]